MARSRLQTHAPVLLAGLPVVGLFVLWAAHDGGYDADTWYWGALAVLALLGAAVASRRASELIPSRQLRLAVGLFTAYVCFSYVSIAWAQAPGTALEGSNRALLYLLVFTLFAVVPWTPEGVLVALVTFVLGIGAIATVMLIELASATHLSSLFSQGRLLSPTGYFNATAALFTITALLGTALAASRRLPVLVRSLLLAVACGALQLALLAQSRGWLFTLPLVLLAALVVINDRLRTTTFAVLPALCVLAALSRLLAIYNAQDTLQLQHAAQGAGKAGLILCAAALGAGVLLALGEARLRLPELSRRARRALGGAVATVALLGAGGGALAATHGHPFRFISRQWHGFTHTTPAGSSGSHFGVVGSGRYDFWRVSLDALIAHPIGGLGQDNFAGYYDLHRRTAQEPSWTHSLEMRLLAHTGLIGFALFGGFLVAGIAAALGGIRAGDGLRRTAAGAALLPLIVWLIHGSVDWFWEMPALTGPALGFLASAGRLTPVAAERAWPGRLAARVPRQLSLGSGAAAFLAAVIVLAFPYLSVREVSIGSDIGLSNPAAALNALSDAASLNPLSSEPARLAGAIALQAGEFKVAEERFQQAIAREPGGWFAWLGDGLAASALGDPTRAHHDFAVAASINSKQPAVTDALARVYTPDPLTVAEAFNAFILVH